MYSGTDYGTFDSVSLDDGLYEVRFMFEIVEAYSI